MLWLWPDSLDVMAVLPNSPDVLAVAKLTRCGCGCGQTHQMMWPNSPDVVAVAEVQSGDDLAEETSSLFRGQPALLHEVVEELPA